MARITESIDIKRPVDKVFAYAADIKSWPKWRSIIVAAEKTSQGPLGVGTTFKGVVHMMGLNMKWNAKVMEYEPNRKCTMNYNSVGMIYDEYVTFDPIEGGTKATVVIDAKVSGFSKLFSPMILSSMHKELKKSLSKMKSILEAQV